MSDEVYLIIIAILVFLNAYLIFQLHARTSKNDGDIVVTTDPETGLKIFSLEIDKSPEEIEAMDIVSFKINSRNGD
jgi:hypothetical protein